MPSIHPAPSPGNRVESGNRGHFPMKRMPVVEDNAAKSKSTREALQVFDFAALSSTTGIRFIGKCPRFPLSTRLGEEGVADAGELQGGRVDDHGGIVLGEHPAPSPGNRSRLLESPTIALHSRSAPGL
jgi:hypothetical protein